LIDWLAGRDPVVSIPARRLDERPLALTAAARVNLSVLALVAQPLIMVSGAIYTWVAKGRRRSERRPA
jgi:hypothetical protein